MPIRFYLSLVTMWHPMTAKHVNLVCSPIPLRSSTEYSASTIPYSCQQRHSSSHSPPPDQQRPITRPKMMMIACQNYRRWMTKMTRRMILMWMMKTMRRKKICLLNWMTTKGRNWSITQRLSAQCWTRCVWMFLLFLCLCTHVHCCYRFANSPSPLSIPPPLSFPHGIMPVPLMHFMCDLSLTMSKLDGIQHMICWM